MKARDSLHPHAWSNSLPPGSGASAFDLAMRRRLLRSLAQRGSSEVAVLIVPGVLCWVYGRDAPAAPMLVWWASFILLMLVLMALRRRMETEASVPDSVAVPRWERLFGWLALAVGAFWAAPIGIALHPGSSDFRLLLYLTLTAVLASATTFLAPLPGLFWRFFAALYLPLLGGVFWFFPTRWPYLLPLLLAFGAVIARHAAGGRRFVQLQARQERRRLRLAEQYRTAKEQAERALADKNRFIAMASHDLRQPLHAMGLFLDTLARSPLTAQQASVLGHARTASGAASEMLTTLLDYSRLEAGVVQAHDAPFAVQPLLSALEQEFGPQADAAALVYRTRETTAAALADKALVDLVMRNFISNALRYTRTGGLLIACRTRSGRLALEVWDTGCGIAPEHQQEVFKEFHQLGNPERDRRKGLGLGLAIVQRLAQAMHTQVEVRSRLGRGSVFRLWLTPWRGALVDEAVASAHDGASLVGRRVLVVDDDEPVRLGMQSLLASWGCHCVCAESAADALARLHQMPQPDVVVTDFRLRHEETGRQVLDTLRAHLQRSVPAIIMTGDTSPQRLRDAQSTGALLLHKPVSAAQLREALVEVLR